MKISQTFRAGTGIPLSFETFPPKGDMPVEQARPVFAGLAPLSPSFVSVTYSAGGSGNSGSTVSVARCAREEFGLTAMAHLTCIGASKESVAAQLDAMKAAGLENILALRGDLMYESPCKDFLFAKDLIPVAREAGFCVGAACYPEGHAACLDVDKDIAYMREKQDAGAEFFVSQLFFDNDVAFRFLERAQAAGITVPITFGIMPFMSKSQITRMVFLCGAGLPSAVVKLLAKYENDEESLQKAGVEYACKQFAGLREAGVDGLHLYTMNKPHIAKTVHDYLFN